MLQSKAQYYSFAILLQELMQLQYFFSYKERRRIRDFHLLPYTTLSKPLLMSCADINNAGEESREECVVIVVIVKEESGVV